MGLFDRLSPTVLRLIALVIVLLLVIAFFATQIDNYPNARLFKLPDLDQRRRTQVHGPGVVGV